MSFRPTRPSLLKLYALPLSRPTASAPPLYYLHPARQPVPKQDDGKPVKLPILNRVTNKAADTWNGFGQKKSGWQKKTFEVGSKLMDKVEYEEWALKGIDVAIAPQPWSSIQSAQSDPKQQTPKKDKVTILYPKSILEPESVLETLKAQLAHREPHHRAMMRRCIFLSPLTWPFAIIPVLPNLPLFYVLFRAYSHYKAWKASSYLLDVIQSPGQLEIENSPQLDKVFADVAQNEEGLLLTHDRAKEVVRVLGLGDDEAGELTRALTQAQARLEQGKAKIEQIRQEKEAKEEETKKD